MEAHQGAFEYDWRARFHLSLTVVGESMTWGEAYRLTHTLSGDPSSAIGAELAGWGHPVTREALTLMDLYDLQHTSKAKGRPRPYPRPWGDKTRRTFGRSSLSPVDLRTLLDRHRREPTT